MKKNKPNNNQNYKKTSIKSEQATRCHQEVTNTNMKQNVPPIIIPSPDLDKKTSSSNYKRLIFLILFMLFDTLILIGCSWLIGIDIDIEKVIETLENTVNDPNIWNKFVTQTYKYLNKYLHIWSFRQWWVSLVGLVFMYIGLIWCLNWLKVVRPITWFEGTLLITIDLLINFLFGLFYMGYPRTIIGALMLQCPIALSPFILAIELTIFFIYVYFKQKKQNK